MFPEAQRTSSAYVETSSQLKRCSRAAISQTPLLAIVASKAWSLVDRSLPELLSEIRLLDGRTHER